MKRILALSLLTCVLISACGGGERPRQVKGRHGPHSFGYTDTEYAEPPAPEATPTPEPRVEATPTPAPVVQATPTPPPVSRHEAARTAIPVPGKPGFVRSPYAPEGGLIDVRGYPTGTEVKDPYAPGKILLVP